MVVNVVSRAAELAAEGVEALRRTGSSLSPHHRAASHDGRSGWLAVTVNRPIEEVAPGGRLPTRLAALGDRIEVRVRPAPADRGTELAARPIAAVVSGATSSGRGDEDLRDEVRTALRQDKQELEVGEVLVLEPVPHGRRRETPTGKLIEEAAKRAGAEGIL